MRAHAGSGRGRRRGFPPSGVPRGAPWELDARSPPRQPKDRLDARRGPTTWEGPADGFKELRAARERLPRSPGRARVPAMTRCSRCPISEISSNVCYSYGGSARGDASSTALWDQSRARVSRVFKRPKNGYSQKRRNDAGFLDVYGRTTGVWTYRRTNAHDVVCVRPHQGRARVAGLPNKLPTLRTAIEQRHPGRHRAAVNHATPPPDHPNERPAARLQV